MAKNDEGRIEKPNLIICEGLDMKLFIIQCLTFLKGENPVFDEFQAMDAQGNSNIPKFIEMLELLSNFEIVKSIIIVRDAEDDASGASDSLKNTLSKCGYSIPEKANSIARANGKLKKISVAYIILPDVKTGLKNGTLEDLCMKILSDGNGANEIAQQAQLAVDSLNSSVNYKRKHKNLLHTYLSLTNEYVSMKIGESAQAGAYDFTSDDINAIKELMIKISR